MLKSLILISLAINIAFAKDRFGEADRKKFLEEVKQGLAAHKVENKGRVDLQIIKPALYEELEVFQKQERFTREEMVIIKQKYEAFSRDPRITPDRAEQELYNFIEKELSEINKKPLQKTREGQVCNNWGCEEGLKCAPDPLQQTTPGQCKKSGIECREDSDCCSAQCVSENDKSKKKVCEDVFRCYRPLDLGQSCMQNPVCGEGACLPFNSLTSGIGECTTNLKACKTNNECCSNSCDGGVCKENYVCKDCVSNGKRPDRGQKCCEGLYINDKGICSPDVPPTVMPQVNNSNGIIKKIFIGFVSLIISDVNAATPSQNIAFDKLNSTVGSSVGSSISFGGGTVTRSAGNSLVFNDGSDIPKTLDSGTNFSSLGSENNTFRRDMVSQLGFDPVGTDFNKNKNTMFELLEGTGVPESSVDMGVDPAIGPFTVNYDSRGIAKSVSTPSGEMDIAKFYRSNYYSALSGNGDGNPTEAEKLAKAKEDKQAAALIEKLEKMRKQATLDNANMTDVINSDRAKYENFRAESEADDVIKVTSPNMKFPKKSNFETCEIRFRDDFYNYLKKEKLFDLELAMLSFDFVLSGEGVSDYWTKNGNGSTSIYNRLKEVALNNRKIRAGTNDKMDAINKRLTCMCLDVQGFENIKLDSKKEFFTKECEEFAKYQDPSTTFDELKGDASGVKGKRLLVYWTQNLESFNAALTIDNTQAYKAIAEVSKFASYDAKWNEAEHKKYTLFGFHIKNPSGSVAAMGAILGALLAAGVIAILGGFASTSILSAWGTMGIITASAVTGAGGVWMIASLKGAWISKRPEIYDKYIRSYGCGKKETCVEYSRELNQPYNNICNVHTSANACVKNFLAFKQEEESRYLVDPWVPYGVTRETLFRSQDKNGTYAEKMEAAFQAAKSAMISRNPGASGGGGKGGGSFVAESYMSQLFIDSTILGHYVPRLGLDMEEIYLLNATQIKAIKDAARNFAIEEEFLEKTDKPNLDAFADYAYIYHFLWPKTSRAKEISYPTVGLTTYLELMSNGVAANMAVGSAKARNVFGNLRERYLDNYLKTLQLYRDQPINQTDAVKKALLDKEINRAQAELDKLKTLNSLAGNTALDSQLVNLNSSFVSQSAKTAGALGEVSFNSDDQNLLKSIGTLRNARKEQLKKLEVFNKAIAASGDKARAARISVASKKFNSAFTSPTTGGGAAGFGSSLSDSLTNGALGDEAKDKSSSSSSNYGNSFGSGGSYGGSYGNNRGGALGTNTTAETKPAEPAAAVNDEDAKRLADAIEARNRSNKDKYKSDEGSSLFEKVTNAYIRNYDKVLTKKKDKDVIEQK